MDYFHKALLLALARRVAPDQRPALGAALTQRIQQAQQPSEQIILTDLALAMPQGLTVDQQLQVATALMTTFLTVLKPTPDPNAAVAPVVPPPPPDAPADVAPPGRLKRAATPFDQDTIGQNRIQLQLGQLIYALPAERSRPLMQQLLVASEKLNDRMQLTVQGSGQAGSDRVRLVLPLLCRFPGDYEPADLARLATIYAKYAIFEGTKFNEVKAGMDLLRGTLPKAVGAKLAEDVAKLLGDRDQGRFLHVEHGLEVLGFLAAHLAPADVEAAAKHVQALEKPKQFAQPIPPMQLNQTLAKFAERLPPAAASAWIDQYRTVAEQNPAQKLAAETIMVAALQPLAADPAAFLTRLQTLKLSPPLQNRALGQLGKGADPAKLADLLVKEKSLFDLSTPPGLDGARQVVSEVPLAARLGVIEKLAATGQFRSGQLAFLTFGKRRDPSATDRDLQTWFAEPDRVGLRRWALLTGSFGGSNQPTMWQVLETR